MCVAILISSIKKSNSELVAAILAVDESILTAQVLRQLVEYIPSNEEVSEHLNTHVRGVWSVQTLTDSRYWLGRYDSWRSYETLYSVNPKPRSDRQRATFCKWQRYHICANDSRASSTRSTMWPSTRNSWQTLHACNKLSTI
jgi:hypothetical protein